MHDDLKDVLSAAVENGREPILNLSARRATQLRAVEAERPGTVSLDAVQQPHLVALVTLPASRSGNESDQLGIRGLRLGFWLCGFQDALIERQERGEQLTPRESSMLEMSRKDFAEIRPLVIAMAVKRLEAVVTSPDILADAAIVGASAPGSLEVFALDTIRSLSARASQLLQDHGADAAISIFGDNEMVMEPLAIFQAVFVTALSVVEAFERIAPNSAKFLPRLSAALDSELERI